MPESFEMSAVFPVRPEVVYQAWLSSAGHSAFTGAEAEIDGRVGGKFTAWDGYIEGTTIELNPPERIVQRWRTTDFPAEAADSLLEIRFEAEGDGTKVTIRHSEIPDGQGEEYKAGWEDYYFAPMAEYFAKAPAS